VFCLFVLIFTSWALQFCIQFFAAYAHPAFFLDDGDHEAWSGTSFVTTVPAPMKGNGDSMAANDGAIRAKRSAALDESWAYLIHLGYFGAGL
jgi:hypothetical protein